ncbi:MAG: serine hydrolase [Cellulophaga sp.]
MKINCALLCVFLILGNLSCSSEPTKDILNLETQQMYFPPKDEKYWETISIKELQWNTDKEQSLYDFLENKNTKAFLILKNGKIVIEKYFGNFSKTTNHTWNSASKTLTAFTAGIAAKEEHLILENTSSNYLQEAWSSLTLEQETLITVKNHLTMTTGLEYKITNTFCTDQECLTYKTIPGSSWYYHNAPYTLLKPIITNATGENFNDYFNSKLRDKIGMQGSWITIGYNHIYFSNARSMARFGLLSLNKGAWKGINIIDQSFFNEMTSNTQTHNEAYGYLWWLNGKDSYRIPSSENLFTGKIIPSAPNDLIAGLGKNDQKIYVIPSKGLVIVRFGDNAGEELLGLSSFDEMLWQKINALITE